MKNYLRVGKIISLHGIKGEVKIFPTTDNIKRFDNLDKFYIIDSDDANDDDFQEAFVYERVSTKYIKNTVILKIAGINTIEDATKFIQKNIYVKRSDAVKLLANEYFVIDMIGLTAYFEGNVFGKVIDIMKTKAHDILVIEVSDKEILVPLVDEYVGKIDINKSLIELKKIEGLI